MAESSAEPRVVVIDKDGDTILILIGPIQELKDFDSNRDSDTDGATETGSDTYSDNDSNSYCVSEVVPAAEAKRVFERHYKVSSLLLKQASKYFRNMFSGGFSEIFPCPDDGKYHIVAKSFHPFALEKVLDIVHLKNLGLQNKIGQEGLAHVAVVVDYYDMYEAVATQTKIWASVTAKDSFLEMFCFDTLVRTFVLKIFGDAKDFEEGAKCVVQTSKGPIPDVGIPMLGVAGKCPSLFQNQQLNTDQNSWTIIASELSRLWSARSRKYPAREVLSTGRILHSLEICSINATASGLPNSEFMRSNRLIGT
jgi:hypothetical protein